MSDDIKTKKCNRCGLILPVSDFDIYHIVNTKSHISVYITEYDNSKWKKYERPIDRVIAGCSELRGETA